MPKSENYNTIISYLVAIIAYDSSVQFQSALNSLHLKWLFTQKSSVNHIILVCH